MGRGRARRAGRRRRAPGIALLLALAGAAVLFAGCGSASHPNEPRPQSPTRVSVRISANQVIVQPTRVALRPEKFQQIPQNQNHPQPPRKTDEPLNVVFVASNMTNTDFHLRLNGPKRATSGTVFANSPGTFQTALPTGTYTVSAAGLPGARPAKLVVGPLRTSSENDVLLP